MIIMLYMSHTRMQVNIITYTLNFRSELTLSFLNKTTNTTNNFRLVQAEAGAALELVEIISVYILMLSSFDLVSRSNIIIVGIFSN